MQIEEKNVWKFTKCSNIQTKLVYKNKQTKKTKTISFECHVQWLFLMS